MLNIKATLKRSKRCVDVYVNLVMLVQFLQICIDVRIKQFFALFKKDTAKMKKYKNMHRGERCFIVGSGPSLSIEDIEMIKEEYSFTVNHGYKIYNKANWQADYFVIMEDNDDGIRCLREALQYNHKGVFCGSYNPNYTRIGDEIKLVSDSKSVLMFDTFWNRYFPKLFPLAQFSEDVSKKIYGGKTVIYACIQLAAYMGFSEIYLLGVDCDYTQKKRYADITDNSAAKEFSANRYADMSRKMRIQFEEMAKIIDKYNIKVYNASRGGALEAFPRIQLEDVISAKN